MAHSGYAKLNLSFPFNTSEKMTNFAFDKKAFRDSTKMDLMLLEMVERSQQIKSWTSTPSTLFIVGMGCALI
jgi:hypothetical protein